MYIYNYCGLCHNDVMLVLFQDDTVIKFMTDGVLLKEVEKVS